MRARASGEASIIQARDMTAAQVGFEKAEVAVENLHKDLAELEKKVEQIIIQKARMVK